MLILKVHFFRESAVLCALLIAIILLASKKTLPLPRETVF